MTELILLAPIAILAGLYWRAERKREAEREESRALLVATLDEHTDERAKLLEHYESARAADRAELKAERSQWARERAQLLNRIQKPDEIYESAETLPTNQHVRFDDDEDAQSAFEEALSFGD